MTTIGMTTRVPLSATEALSAEAFAKVRRRMVLKHCKWDPQVGDRGTLAPFAVRLSTGAWGTLRGLAEKLATETVAAEAALMRRPDLWNTLGVPRKLQRVLTRWPEEGLTPSAARVMRFDFHCTRAGWRISEVNSDVPGGYSEAWNFARLMNEALGGEMATAGDPGLTWARAIARSARHGRICLVAAPGYLEDQQVVRSMAERLREVGCEAEVAEVRRLSWVDGKALVRRGAELLPVDAVLRFHQAEWLASGRQIAGWQHFFVGGRTLVTNPGAAMLTESKGLPLVWDRLETPMETWRELLPRTCAVCEVRWRDDERWILKGKYSNNGDEVIFPERVAAATLRRVLRDVWWRPNAWVAQERFEAKIIETPAGLMTACLGVYVVDGEAVGIYGRLSPGPVVDYAAMDVAVLVERDEAWEGAWK